MNLFLYFCIPLVVTGQTMSNGNGGSNRKIIRGYFIQEEANPAAAATDAYSKFAFGDAVGYRNPAGVMQFITGPMNMNEDSNPSDIYNNLKSKRINGQNPQEGGVNGMQHEPAVLRHQQNPALIQPQNFQPNQYYVPAQSPLVKTHPDAQLAQPSPGLIPLQYPSPYALQSLGPVYQPTLPPEEGPLSYPSGLISPYQYQPELAPHPGLIPAQHPGYLGPQYSGHVPAQHPGFVTAQYPGLVPLRQPGLVPVYQQGLVPAQYAGLQPAHYPSQDPNNVIITEQKTVTKAVSPIQPVYYSSSLGPNPSYKTVLKQAPAPVLLKPQHAPVQPQQPVLLKENFNLAHDEVYKRFKSPEIVTSNGGLIAYQGPRQKQPQVLLKNTDPTLVKSNHYKTQEASPIVHQNNLLKNINGVEAHIVPAVEDHLQTLEEELPGVPALALSKTKGIIQATNLPEVSVRFVSNSKQKKVLPQTSLIENTQGQAEKAVLKTAYYQPPAASHASYEGLDQQAVSKAPGASYNSHVEPGLPTRILKSQKSLVKAIISSDSYGKSYNFPKGKTILELVPSIAFSQQSYSQYPNQSGMYGNPEPYYVGHGHHGHVDHHYNHQPHVHNNHNHRRRRRRHHLRRRRHH